MKKGTVYISGWSERKYIGQISIEPPLVLVFQGKEENYRRLTIPLTSVIMIEWEDENNN